MTIAFRSHLDTHQIHSQRIGAGLVRQTCLQCGHISVSDEPDRPPLASSDVPDWMRRAAERFAAA